MLEVGYRCAVPNCREVDPLEIEHIEEWSKVKEHKFENMIVLCANCHRRKGKGPRKLDQKALKQLKINLGLVNNRYNETERRILEHFIDEGLDDWIVVPGTTAFYKYLIKDGLIKLTPDDQAEFDGFAERPPGNRVIFVTLKYVLTDAGKVFVTKMQNNEDLYEDTYTDNY